MADLERIILDLESRILKLNDQVENLSQKVDQLEKAQVVTKEKLSKPIGRKTKIKGKISKNTLVECIKKALAGKIPADAIRKGTRNEKASVIISKENGKQIRILLRGSGYYGKEDTSSRMNYTGFSTLPEHNVINGDGHIEDTDVQMSYDFYIFGVSHGDDPQNPQVEFFIFDQQQFKNFLQQKSYSGPDDKRVYYFYFGETNQGKYKYIDDRERDKELPVDEEHNNWSSIVKKYEEA